MEKLDLRKSLKEFYQPSAKAPVLVDVPEMLFAMIDGRIEAGETPGTSAQFGQAMMALYGVSFTLKFMSKLRKVDPIDYGVTALEALWWSATGDYSQVPPENWRWIAMMMQPDHITQNMFAEAVEKARAKKPSPAFDRIRLERWREGPSVQIMHIGPYSAEPATVARLHAFAADSGYRLRDAHHEIYLSDPRRTAPEKLKTVLRHPVENVV